MNKITKNIEAIYERHNCAADAAQTLRRQMATTGRPMVTYNQLVLEATIAAGRSDAKWAKVCSSIFGEMISQEMVDSGHTREVCMEYLRRNLATGRIRVAKMSEVFRSYTDETCRTAGKPFVRLSVMGAVRDALDVLELTGSGPLAAAAKADSLVISEKLAQFAAEVRAVSEFVDEGGDEITSYATDEEVLVAMDDQYIAV